MLHLVQLEPLEERYTEQWSRWIPNALSSLNIPFVEILGEKLTDNIEVGDVLDVYGTCYWKNTQLNTIVKKIRSGEIKDGDELWFADLWFPGIEQIKYIMDITGIKIKITGVLHAGTWDKKDFTVRYGMDKWATGFEETLFQIADEIHLGSKFHKELIMKDLEKRLDVVVCVNIASKLKVTGLFFDHIEVRGIANYDGTKEVQPIVVFPHRLAPEKQPEAFDALKTNPKFAGHTFLKTVEVTKGKKEYYDLLKKARFAVSFEGQETFGYAILEAMALGCVPVVYNGMSYTDTVPEEFRSFDVEDLLSFFILQDSNYLLEIPMNLIQEKLDSYMPEVVASQMFTSYL